MKTNKKTLALLRLAAAIVTVTSIYLFAPWRPGLYYLSFLPDTVEEELDAAVAYGLDGIIIYADRPGEKPVLLARGYHDRAAKVPAYPEALFKIASVAKLYDAVALTKLVTRGDLALDDTLEDLLPDLAPRIANADKVTLEMLVRHRSGIPNFTDQPGYSWTGRYPDVLALIYNKPADFEPGADYGYSNSNYVLLHRLMSKQLGFAHSQFITTEILDPLGLETPYFSINSVNHLDVMSGYYTGSDEDFKPLDHGYIARARDVGIFLRALNDGSLLNDREAALYSGLYTYDHTGWVLGYQSVARYHKESDRVVILFMNTVGDHAVLMRDIVYNRVVDILENTPVTQ